MFMGVNQNVVALTPTSFDSDPEADLSRIFCAACPTFDSRSDTCYLIHVHKHVDRTVAPMTTHVSATVQPLPAPSRRVTPTVCELAVRRIKKIYVIWSPPERPPHGQQMCSAFRVALRFPSHPTPSVIGVSETPQSQWSVATMTHVEQSNQLSIFPAW